MRRKNIYLLSTWFILTALLLASCKKKDPPTVSTWEVSEITLSSAIAGGTVSSDGGADVTARGVCWSTHQLPTTSDNMTSDGTGTGEFTSVITGLEEGTTYYVRAYATNSEGTSYGEEVSFITGETTLATLTTSPVTSITTTSGITGGNITNDGQSPVTARGVVWGTSQNPTVGGDHTTDGAGTGEFTSNLTGLADETTYYVRAYATNNRGTAYGNEVSFTTAAPVLAALTTVAITNLTLDAATGGGNITDDGGSPVTERGIVWGTATQPTTEDNRISEGTGPGMYEGNITGLAPGTVYYVRAYATNKAGTAYGNEIRFVTPVADVEGNVYRTTLIGNQIWMAENLSTTLYNNNTPIPHVTDNSTWINLATPAYAWYNNNIENKPSGALYNWFAASNDNLCPQGWHVPTNAEFEAMEAVAGVPADSVTIWGWRGTDVGTKLKDLTGWSTGNGTNVLEFSATGSGYRAWTDGQFRGRNEIAYYWSATDDAVNAKPEVAYYRRLDGTSHYIYKGTTGKESGKSIRCVKNP